MGKLFPSSVKMLYRNKQSLFWALAFPIIFTVVFGMFDFEAQGDIRVALVESQPGPIAEAQTAVEQSLEQVDFFKVTSTPTVDAGKQLVTDDEADVVIAVLPGSAPPQVVMQTYYNQGNPQQNQVAFTALSQIVSQMNLEMSGVSEPPVTLEKEAVSSKSVSYYDFILPGLVAMGVMNYSISGIAVSLSRYREQRILKRILATPLAPSHFLVAQVFAHLLLALVQAILILAVGILLFGGNVYGSIPALLLLVTLANVIFLNIGFAIAGRASNPEAASGVANAVALPMMFLSGVFFPTSTLPDVMQKIVALLPLTPLIEAMRKISIDGATITDCGTQMAALAIWVVVSFALARMNFSFSERGA